MSLHRRSTDSLIEDMSTGQAQLCQPAALSCLPPWEESQLVCDRSDPVFDDLSDLEESIDGMSPAMWSQSSDEVEHRECHDARLCRELECFMSRGEDLVSPPTVGPSEPMSSQHLPALLPTKVHPTSSRQAPSPRPTTSAVPNLLERLLAEPNRAPGVNATQEKRRRGCKRPVSRLLFRPSLYVMQHSHALNAALSKLVIQDGIPHLKRRRQLKLQQLN